MARDLSKPLGAITFNCGDCYRTFKAQPSRVADDPENLHHPYQYFGTCTLCKSECEQVPWEKSLLKAWANATGPKTPEGIAASARNLEGHPTPEEALRTRFNAMKHGMNAKVANFFPAKPDGYAFCKSCDVDRVWCGAQPACVKQTQNFMMHHAAFETRNPSVLNGVYAEMHAALFAVLQQILQTIIADGVKIVSPEWYTTKDGEMFLADYHDSETGEKKTIMNISAHPLFKPLGELLTRTGLTLSDMGMTVRQIEDDDEQMGNLATATREDAASFSRAQTKALEDLRGLMARASEQSAKDPVLIEYREQNGDAA